MGARWGIATAVGEQAVPVLFILSGPSGVGKDTVISRLRNTFRDVHFAVTATTRLPRPGEEHGKSYFFLTRSAFDAMLDRDELLAPAKVHGNWYGAPLEPIRQALVAGTDVFLKIDVQGAIQVRRRLPQAVFVFLAPPSLTDLVSRLVGRHTEDEANFERRLRDAEVEMAEMPRYDYVVVNRYEDVDDAVRSVACIITAERLRTHRQPIVLE
jgi:guanylate kinase